MTARNDITGDAIASRAPSDSYRDRWDAIFGRRGTPAVREAQQLLTDLAQAEGFGLCDKCDPDKCCRL